MPNYAITNDHGAVSAVMEADSIGVTSSGAISFYKEDAHGLPAVFHVLHADAYCQVGMVERKDDTLSYVNMSRVQDFMEAS